VESILPDVHPVIGEAGLLQVEEAIPMYLAARCRRRPIRVMYTGQAADEHLAAIPW
jgi:asparagine synthase (glutamine-hydrolysing)